MPFDVMRMETCRVLNYKGVKYQVLGTTDSGLLLVAKEEDVLNQEYPLQVYAIPEED